MLRYAKMWIVLVSIVCSFTAQAEDETALTLFLGEVKVLKLGKIERVAVGNGGVVSTSALDNGQLLVLAEKEGLTSVHIWMKDGNELRYLVNVTKEPPTQDSGEVEAMLASVPGLTVRTVGNKVLLEGRVENEYGSVIDTVKAQYDNIVDLTRRSAPRVERHKMVLMDVKITEFLTSRLDELGISWSNPIPGPTAGLAYDPVGNNKYRGGNPTDINGTFADLPLRVAGPAGFFGIATEITSRLNFLVNSGDAVLLAQPRLAARSGGEAQFLSGGEIPIVTVSQNGTNIEYKEFGIRLNVTPTVDVDDNILATVETEVSSIDNSVSVQGVPGFASRKTRADISMRAGETLVLSGLLNQETSKDMDKIAGLGDIPLLGALFRSKTFRNRQSELVIFVTPTIIDAASEVNRRELARHQEMKDKYRANTGADKIELLD